MSDRRYATILVAVGEGVCTITLNRPDRRNAIGPQMMNELLWALSDAEVDRAVRTIVLTGAGKAFCGGGDFGAMSGDPGADALPIKGDFPELMLAMVRSTKPIVARVNGHAMGGGVGLVAASTFAVASTDAQLGTPEIDRGLFPMMIMAVLARVVPKRRLLEMMLFGERMSAEEAARIGLVSKAVAPEQLDAAVAEYTSKIAKKSPTAVKLGLEAFAAQEDMDLAAALPMLRDRLGAILGTNDAREGLMAFLEKREPKWTGT